jgi:hypothetical protein
MPTVLRKTSLLLAVSLALTGSAAINTATAQTKPATTRPESNQSETDSQDTSDTADDELETAAVSLDLSHSSPLIQKLYQATRETKEQDILARLSEAKKLLADGADVKATDQYGRTALHWTVFGSSYNTKPNVIVSYEEMADQLLQKGIDINHEDTYNDTAPRLPPLFPQLRNPDPPHRTRRHQRLPHRVLPIRTGSTRRDPQDSRRGRGQIHEG